jgi:ABC-2 type transport system ATP-binding protein
VVGLTDRGSTRVGTFSKGMQQRLGLGVALLGDPELVLLDEPTSALDPVGRHDVREIIRALKERGMTVFLNSHLLTEVEQVCDRVTIVDHGKVVAEGTLDELLRSDTVRIRATDLPRDAPISLERFGAIAQEGEWLTVRGVDAERIPELVAEIVRLGGRVYAVEPKHESLEDRFLQLLGGA